MRETRKGALGAGVVWCTLLWACEPVPMSDGHFWPARPDGGSPAAPGSGGSTVPDGTGGVSGGAVGSGGAGTVGSGGTGGGATSTGGMTGSGGRQGTGGSNGSGGMFGSGGSSAAGGRASSSGGNGSGGTGAPGGAGGSGVSSGVLTGTLKVSVTTVSAGGRYAPDNVGAIWIADSSSKFVKSLYVWAAQRRRNLSTWTSATSAAGLANNVVDAVTAATLSGHGVRTATWNATNTSKTAVPDGAYKVCFELRDGGGQSQCVDFMKNRTAQTLMPADTATFTKRSLVYTP